MSHGGHIIWHDKEFLAELDRQFNPRLKQAGLVVVREAKKLMDSTRPVPKRKGVSFSLFGGLIKIKAGFKKKRKSKGKGGPLSAADAAKRKKTSLSNRRKKRSKPGEPPFVQTGSLKRSITRERQSPMVEAVGTNLKYGKFLELGTSKMAPRPFLRPALAKSQKKLIQILTRPMTIRISGKP